LQDCAVAVYRAELLGLCYPQLAASPESSMRLKASYANILVCQQLNPGVAWIELVNGQLAGAILALCQAEQELALHVATDEAAEDAFYPAALETMVPIYVQGQFLLCLTEGQDSPCQLAIPQLNPGDS